LTAAARDILRQLAELGAAVDRRGDSLILRAGVAPVPKEVLTTIRERKAEMLAALAPNAVAPPMPPSPAFEPSDSPLDPAAAIWSDAEDERAAIVEHDGNIPRSWAEGFARLDPDRPLGDVPLRRWRQFVDDVGLFLDSPFCAVAATLDWGPHDLFGSDRDRPLARIDKAGVLWLSPLVYPVDPLAGKVDERSKVLGRLSHLVSNRPIWLAEAAKPVIARMPTTHRIAGGTAARRRSHPRSRPAARTRIAAACRPVGGSRSCRSAHQPAYQHRCRSGQACHPARGKPATRHRR
jgi:hypothetical protein